MPARDIFHNAVRNALINDGWTITDDPLRLELGGQKLYVDLGAERLLGAEKEGERIAVEIKSFVGKSGTKDLEDALGQYILYRAVLERSDPQRKLYLAVSGTAYSNVFEEPLGQTVVESEHVKLFVFDRHKGVILKWIP